MSRTSGPIASPLHPFHAVLLAFPVALFPSALVSDIAFLNTAEMQWSNLSAWAITGALLMGAPVVLWAVIVGLRASGVHVFRRFAYPALLLGMWVAGLINAFQHSRDAWASVGTAGLVLSIVSSLCAIVAAWIAHSGVHAGGVR